MARQASEQARSFRSSHRLVNMSSVDISGLDKVDVLYAIWQASSPAAWFGQFMGVPPPVFNWEEARRDLGRHGCYVDYFCGRCIKLDFRSDALDPRLFDRDYGQGAVARAVQKLRANK